MKVRLACVECIVKQARVTAELCTTDPGLREEITKDAMRRLASRPLDRSPAEHSMAAYDAARELSGVADPYAAAKRRYNEMVLGMYQDLRKRIQGSPDPLRIAAKLALVGNIIDLGLGLDFDLQDEIEKTLQEDMAIDHQERFREELESASTLLFLCDNAGEIVFDKLFLEELRREFPRLQVTAVVKSGPIINDATMEDAESIGLGDVARVIPSGGAFIGIPCRLASDEVRKRLQESDLVVSKGQGNFETVSDLPRPVYYMVKAKCWCVADELGISQGNVAFLRRTGGRK